MKQLLLLCTKNVHFIFDNNIFQQRESRVYQIYFTKELLDEKLKPIEREYIEIKWTPKWIINQLKEKHKLVREQNYQKISTNIDSNTVTTTTHILALPSKCEKGEEGEEEDLTENHLSRYACRSKKMGFSSTWRIKHNCNTLMI